MSLLTVSGFANPTQAFTQNQAAINLPEKPLRPQSLQVTTLIDKPYVEWNEQERSSIYDSIQKIVALWKKERIADQYLTYGKQSIADRSFTFEIIPYHKTSSIIGRIWQQFIVLWNMTFGASKDSKINEHLSYYRDKLNGFTPSSESLSEKTTVANDAFCKKEVIDRQKVLEGKYVNVLFNYAPIGFGGERLHFLIVPKEHRSEFTEVTSQEYLETTNLSQKLIRHFSKTRPIQAFYLFDKTGQDAGQTVPHWHQHLILTANKAQDIFGKLTVLKNMLLGSSPMKEDELKIKVQSLRQELSQD